jgi:hypothetical protein
MNPRLLQSLNSLRNLSALAKAKQKYPTSNNRFKTHRTTRDPKLSAYPSALYRIAVSPAMIFLCSLARSNLTPSTTASRMNHQSPDYMPSILIQSSPSRHCVASAVIAREAVLVCERLKGDTGVCDGYETWVYVACFFPAIDRLGMHANGPEDWSGDPCIRFELVLESLHGCWLMLIYTFLIAILVGSILFESRFDFCSRPRATSSAVFALLRLIAEASCW